VPCIRGSALGKSHHIKQFRCRQQRSTHPPTSPLRGAQLLLKRRILRARPPSAPCWPPSTRPLPDLHPCKGFRGARHPYIDCTFLSSYCGDLQLSSAHLVPQVFSSVSEMAQIGAPSRSHAVEQRLCLPNQSSSSASIRQLREQGLARLPLHRAIFQTPVGGHGRRRRGV
jgi:hypothetical protein